MPILSLRHCATGSCMQVWRKSQLTMIEVILSPIIDRSEPLEVNGFFLFLIVSPVCTYVLGQEVVNPATRLSLAG